MSGIPCFCVSVVCQWYPQLLCHLSVISLKAMCAFQSYALQLCPVCLVCLVCVRHIPRSYVCVIQSYASQLCPVCLVCLVCARHIPRSCVCVSGMPLPLVNGALARA